MAVPATWPLSDCELRYDLLGCGGDSQDEAGSFTAVFLSRRKYGASLRGDGAAPAGQGWQLAVRTRASSAAWRSDRTPSSGQVAAADTAPITS